tara:strand:+ start:5059 stop:5328 length:270 start_codon:yes stop_codon:yes gene_type:complete
MSKLETTENQQKKDELILIAHLSKGFHLKPEEIIKDWNNGNILCWDWAGLVEFYEGLEDVLNGTIEEGIAFDLENGILVKVQSLYFMYA